MRLLAAAAIAAFAASAAASEKFDLWPEGKMPGRAAEEPEIAKTEETWIGKKDKVLIIRKRLKAVGRAFQGRVRQADRTRRGLPGRRVRRARIRARGDGNRGMAELQGHSRARAEIPRAEQSERGAYGRPARHKNRPRQRERVEHRPRKNRHNGVFRGREPFGARLHAIRGKALRAR